MVHVLPSPQYLHPPLLQHLCWPFPLVLDVQRKHLPLICANFCSLCDHDSTATEIASMAGHVLGTRVSLRFLDLQNNLPFRRILPRYYFIHDALSLQAFSPCLLLC